MLTLVTQYGWPRGMKPSLEGVLVKVEPALQQRLLELQAVDSRLDQLEHQRRTLPQLATLAELDSQLAVLADRIVAAETEVTDLQRAQTKAHRIGFKSNQTARPRHHERRSNGDLTVITQIEDERLFSFLLSEFAVAKDKATLVVHCTQEFIMPLRLQRPM